MIDTTKQSTFTTKDFEEMQWHDVIIHAMKFSGNYELRFDIDYIFKWIEPKAENEYYSFITAPCTLIFKNVHRLQINVELTEPFILQMDDIIREVHAKSGKQEYKWEIETQQGEISLYSSGYEMYVRKIPTLVERLIADKKLIRNTSF